MKDNKIKKEDMTLESNLAKLRLENHQLQQQVQILADLTNLREESYYRRQMLVVLERIALALESSLKEEDTEEKDSDEEEEEEEDESED